VGQRNKRARFNFADPNALTPSNVNINAVTNTNDIRLAESARFDNAARSSQTPRRCPWELAADSEMHDASASSEYKRSIYWLAERRGGRV
jgi:hypothetical protein